MNVDRPIVAGGTGASTALAALTNLFSGASPGGADKIGFWDQSAASFAFLSLGTGLTFNGTTLELDADLSTLAGLTVAADNFIAGNSGGTAWEVKTPANARTSLGLGTAAVVNTGTSGATIPLLNAANTFSTTQVFSLTNAGGAAQGARIANGSGDASSSADLSLDPGNNGFGSRDAILRATNNGGNQITFSILQADGGAPATTLSITPAGVATMLGNTMWHAGNDGAGSGLDADTLDGVQGSGFAQLASSNTFTGTSQIFRANSVLLDVYVNTGSGGTGTPGIRLRTDSRYDEIQFNSAGMWFVLNTTGTPQYMKFDTSGGLQARVAASSETSGTLTSASANKQITAAGGITIPASVFAAGDCILIDGGGTARTITRGSGLTMYKAGSDSATATLAANGVMGVRFRSATVCVLTGDVT